MEINKEKAILHVRSDIFSLSVANEASEIYAFVNRVRGQIGLLVSLGILSMEEGASLEDEMAVARKTAAANIEK